METAPHVVAGALHTSEGLIPGPQSISCLSPPTLSQAYQTKAKTQVIFLHRPLCSSFLWKFAWENTSVASSFKVSTWCKTILTSVIQQRRASVIYNQVCSQRVHLFLICWFEFFFEPQRKYETKLSRLTVNTFKCYKSVLFQEAIQTNLTTLDVLYQLGFINAN